MKILLAYHSGSTTHDESTIFTDLLPIGLCSLHALLRSRGYDAYLANFSRMTPKQADDLLLTIKPDLVGLSQWTHNRHVTTQLANQAKNLIPDCLVVLGGGHATHQAEPILARHPAVDLIVAGEGEQTLLELIEAIENKTDLTTIAGLVLRQGATITRTAPRSRLHDLDQLPFPASFLHEAYGVDLELQPQFISTARGCPSACRFCSSPTFWGTSVCTRSPDSVVDEFLFLRERFGMVYLSLRDDTFTADRQRVIDLCKRLIERRATLFWNCQTRVETVDDEVLIWMKRAGCECVQLGVESGSRQILKLLGKRITPEQVISAAAAIHRIGLQLSTYLIAGIPGESTADKQATLDLLARIRPHDLQIAPLAYYPGTALFMSAVRNGTVASNLFDHDNQHALLALKTGPREAATLLHAAGNAAPELNTSLLATQRKQTGYCAVGSMQTGDFYARQGSWKKAEQAYQEITVTEPDHPWGWLLLAELYAEIGREKTARDCYLQVLKLVPRHRQSQLATQQGH